MFEKILLLTPADMSLTFAQFYLRIKKTVLDIIFILKKFYLDEDLKIGQKVEHPFESCDKAKMQISFVSRVKCIA